MNVDARLRKLRRLTVELQAQVDMLAAANARLQAAYRDLEAALRIADEARTERCWCASADDEERFRRRSVSLAEVEEAFRLINPEGERH